MKKTFIPLLLLVLAACQGPPPPPGVKVGKPYAVAGKMYYPEYDPTYDETGIASWYGPGFHGASTANGEQFNTHDLTAAHPTLPMPSIVRVTNLQNGKSLVVRINDRGPFAAGRIIDLSRASAKRLGIDGLAKVRVQYLRQESDEYIAAVKERRRVDMIALNDRLERQKEDTVLASTAPPDQSFIIESTQNLTQPGDTVVRAAPVVSVSGSDLPVQHSSKSRGVLVRDAMAEEGVGSAPVVLETSADNDSDINMVTVSETPTSKPAPAQKAGGFAIQVGSFSQKENAEKMKRAIARITASNITQVDVGGHRWWRVQAGPFANNEKAMAALDAIRAGGAPDARIIRP